MMDLRNLRKAALDAVHAENERDHRWNWHLWDVGNDSIEIRWSYLDYIGQKANFSITYHEDSGDCWFSADMGNDFIDDSPVVTVGNSRWDDAKTLESGIAAMVRRVAIIAHARY